MKNNESLDMMNLPTMNQLLDCLSKYRLPPVEDTSKQVADENPRMTAAMLITETALDSQVLFAPFRLLPTELRLYIWNFARPEPRIVRLLKSKHYSKHYSYPTFISKAPVPSMLHACRESGEIAMKWYKFTSQIPVDSKEVINRRFHVLLTYFDMENDILYAGCKICRKLRCDECKLSPSYTGKVRRILFHWEDDSYSPFLELYMFFSAAKEVMILGAGNDNLDPEFRFDQLVKTSAPFRWQKKTTLQEDCVASMLETENKLKELEEAMLPQPYMNIIRNILLRLQKKLSPELILRQDPEWDSRRIL